MIVEDRAFLFERLKVAKEMIDQVIYNTDITPIDQREYWTNNIIWGSFASNRKINLRMVTRWIRNGGMPNTLLPQIGYRRYMRAMGRSDLASQQPGRTMYDTYPFDLRPEFNEKQKAWINKTYALEGDDRV